MSNRGVIFDDFPKFSWMSQKSCWTFTNFPAAPSSQVSAVALGKQGHMSPCRGMVDWNSDQDITVICNPESYRKFGIANIVFTVGAWYLHVFATRIYLTFWNEYVGYLLQPPSSSHFFNHLWEVTESGRLASRHFLPILVLGKLESRDLGTWFLTLNDEWLTTACHLQTHVVVS